MSKRRVITFSKTVNIDGKRWRLEFVNDDPAKLEGHGEVEGLCDFAERKITIYLQNVEDVELTVLHEALHAACPYLAEHEVEKVSRILRDVQKKLE